MANCVVRTDLLSGTTDPSMLEHGRYYESGETPKEIQNGSIVYVDALEEGERESHKYLDVPEEATLQDLVLIAEPEMFYDTSKHPSLADYINEAGKVIRGYYLHPNGEFSVTKEGFKDDAPNVGDKVYVSSNEHTLTKSEGGVLIGTVTRIETYKSMTMYCIKIGKEKKGE